MVWNVAVDQGALPGFDHVGFLSREALLQCTNFHNENPPAFCRSSSVFGVFLVLNLLVIINFLMKISIITQYVVKLIDVTNFRF